MAKIVIDKLHKKFPGSKVSAVEGFSLDIGDGELIAFLGPSGCGKTTTLRMIAGFVEPTSGHVLIGDRNVTHVPVHKRNIGMVFQRYALFPHMTVSENIAFGLEMHKVAKSDRSQRIAKALDMVRMVEYKDRYPRQLSGGQQQRVSIARALAIEPQVFLLDEPLSALDAKLRVEVRDEIRELQQRLGLTTIFVTHDQEEALAIADRMVVMHDGKVQQVADAKTLYEQPQNLFVASFLGKMNFFEGVKEGNRFRMRGGQVIAIPDSDKAVQRIGVRPELIRLESHEPENCNALEGKISSIVYLGPQIDIHVRLRSGEDVSVQMTNNHVFQSGSYREGADIFVCFDADNCVAFRE